MKVSEQKLYNSLCNRKPLKTGTDPYMKGHRDVVTITEEGYEVALWGHIIAERKGNRLELCDCGYETATTTSRLNVVCQYEHLPLRYRIKNKAGFFEDQDGNEYRSGHIIWDFLENRIVEE